MKKQNSRRWVKLKVEKEWKRDDIDPSEPDGDAVVM
jgi:hypothetical protein